MRYSRLELVEGLRAARSKSIDLNKSENTVDDDRLNSLRLLQMKARRRGAAGSDIAVQRLDDNRYVLTVDGIVALCRYAKGTRAARRNSNREE